MSFYDRYERVCRLRGLEPCSQHAAELFGITKGTISAWKRNSSAPKGETIILIANGLGVSADYLLERKLPMTLEESARRALEAAFVRINVYGTIPAGIPMEAIEGIIDTEDIPAKWLEGGREYFALRVQGDSMYPQYLDGDTVIFRRTNVWETGDDCVVYIGDGEATLKRVFKQADGSIEIRPLNPHYPPRVFTRDQMQAERVSIGGVAVELRRRCGS